MRYYVGYLHKDESSDYGVSFYDFPGCVGAGDTAQAAVDDAFQALKTHMELTMEAGSAIPEPSTVEAVEADAAAEGARLVMVPAPALPGKVLRVNITLPEQSLKAFDAFAAGRSMTRSGLIQTAVKAYIAAGGG